MQQIVIGNGACHHGLANGHRPDADTRVMTAPGDHIDLFVRYMNTIDMDEATTLQGILEAERAKAPKAGDEEFMEEEEFFEDE